MNDSLTPVLKIDPGQLSHVVIRASAGSGKTHALSGRYLSLLAAGVEPNRILATTFTRAAAGEIRDRLMKRLATAASNDASEGGKARKDLAQSMGVDRVESHEALEMLVRLSRAVHTMQIRTLDSFFATVVRTFAIELGLPPEGDVIDEHFDHALRQEALRLLLDEREPDALIELLRLLTRGDADRGVTETIDRTVGSLHELWRETEPEAWQWIPEPQGLLSQKDLVEAIDVLSQCAIPKDKRFANARQGDLESAMAGDWKAFISSGLGKRVVSDDLVYYGKSIDGELLEAYRPLTEHAAAELIHRAREQTLATQAMIALFDRQYARLKHRHRALTFADLTYAMRNARRLGTLDDIGFRLDARIHHLLLDEFQDTSSAQWQALRGMCDEVTGQEPPRRTFFCVGDVKQSIYGWRGASPEILDQLATLLPGTDKRSLDRSYRSSQVVIDVVNAVFSNVSVNPSVIGDAAHMSAASAWDGTFQHHDVAEHLRLEPGYVELRTIVAPANADLKPNAKPDAKARLKARLTAAADLAADLYRRESRLRIALLTRTNASVARLLYELGPARRGVPVSGRGGGPLIDAPPVNAMLDLLRLADHPDDTVSAFNVARSPLGAALKFTDFAAEAERWRLARNVRQSLLLDGYQTTIARWVRIIAPKCDVRERRRATQLVELAGLHDAAQPGLRTHPFIDLVESKDVPDSQPAPIEVMTVHQAKGLEFDVVILAELSGKLRGAKEPMVVFDRDDHSGCITRIARHANKETQALLPELVELTERTRARTVRESLSVLYVAMTRAKHGLYMLIDPPGESERTWPATAEGVLRGALVPSRDDCLPNAVVYAHGDPNWLDAWKRDCAATTAAKTASKAAPVATIRLGSDGQDAGSTGAAISPSAARERAMARARAAALRSELHLTNPEGRERGSVIHALFEQIEWLEDSALDDDALKALARSIAPRRDEQWHGTQVATFRKMLAKPAIAGALSRGDVDAKAVRVMRELPYVRAIESGIQSGVIDRLVLRLDSSGKATSAIVIDFKTDAIVEDSAEAQAETHREQLQAYREIVAEMFAIPIKRIGMQVLLVGAGASIAL